ncbi:MAG: PTS sugar transporter subunit IIA [Planctomycetota bacterium]|nr:MAG: PTS sugar transporter subunit IIA [Planctomycetota bacterium]
MQGTIPYALRKSGDSPPGDAISQDGLDLETLTAGSYVRVGLSARSKEAAIERLLDVLLSEGALPVSARDELLEAVLERERRLSTGLEAGIAIPHGTTHRVEREVAALGVFPEGVPFGAVDGSLTRIVILLITPADLRHRHVKNLAEIARQLLRPEVRSALLEARSDEEALEAIRRRES